MSDAILLVTLIYFSSYIQGFFNRLPIFLNSVFFLFTSTLRLMFEPKEAQSKTLDSSHRGLESKVLKLMSLNFKSDFKFEKRSGPFVPFRNLRFFI